MTYAQFNDCDRWSMGLNFTLTNPIGEMNSNEFRANYGFTFNTLYNLNPRSNFLNFHIGGKVALGWAIGEKNNITLEDPVDAAARSSKELAAMIVKLQNKSINQEM